MSSDAFVATGDVNGDDTTGLLVGVYWGTGGEGHVYIYRGSAQFDTIPWLELSGGHGDSGEEFGISVASGGDVNKDGFQDVAVGAFQYGDGTNAPFTAGLVTGTWNYVEPGRSGKLYILYGGSPMDSVVDVSIIGRTDSSGLGAWCSSAGDIDTNQYGDVIASAMGDGKVACGTAYNWLGNMAMDTVPDAWLVGTPGYSNVGVRVACAGDVNGDGKDEVMMSNYSSTTSPLAVWVCKYTGPGVEETSVHSSKFIVHSKLYQNQPNPFSSQTAIRYSLPAMSHEPRTTSHTTLKVYNIADQLVKTLVNEPQEPGYYAVRWDGKDENGKPVASGVYFYRLQAGDFSATKKMILLR
ncbi:MAG: FlgD immunoglobulin-like domain containing protein [Candidatus Edwardsbacteria bacterium]